MITISKKLGALLIALSSSLIATSALAVVVASEPLTFTFDFNNVALPLSTATVPGFGLGNVGLSDKIGLAMTDSLHSIAPTSSVAVAGAVATQDYSGEGHVVKQPNGVAKTLGNSDGSSDLHLKMDTFIVNNNFGLRPNTPTSAQGGGATSNAFSMTFTNFFVTGVSFDYEIFPDYTCQKGNLTCVSDFSLYSDKSPAIALWYKSVHSTATVDAQSLGTTAVINTFGAQTLTFADWPAEIGIDNLVITGCVAAVNGQCGPSKVPEPATLALFGLGLFGVAALRRKRLAQTR